MARRRVDIVGCPVDPVSIREVCDRIRTAVDTGRPLHVVTANVDFVMRARRDDGFRRLLGGADLVVADGVPLTWVAALQGEPLAGRVNGTQLVWECARLSAEAGFLVGLLGAAPGVAEEAAAELRARHPGARLAVIEAPSPLDLEDPRLSADVGKRAVDVLLVALGAPKQERWLSRWLRASGADVGIGIGGALDLVSGRKPRAPRWMQHVGLEWLHRLLTEPRRLSRRYLVEDVPFVWLAIVSVLRKRFRSIRSR